MITRDAEALEYVASSGHWRVTLDGEILTRRDKRGKVTSPEVWRPCEFISKGNRSQARHRIWVNGRRVYSNRVVWRLTQGPIPEGMQVDHIDDNAMNRDPLNLQLLDCHGNISKEVRAGRVFWFKPNPKEGVIPALTMDAPMLEHLEEVTEPGYGDPVWIDCRVPAGTPIPYQPAQTSLLALAISAIKNLFRRQHAN
jgi:hypothetical protein